MLINLIYLLFDVFADFGEAHFIFGMFIYNYLVRIELVIKYLVCVQKHSF